eukprot:1098653-Rhodomonas_salina.1
MGGDELFEIERHHIIITDDACPDSAATQENTAMKNQHVQETRSVHDLLSPSEKEGTLHKWEGRRNRVHWDVKADEQAALWGGARNREPARERDCVQALVDAPVQQPIPIDLCKSDEDDSSMDVVEDRNRDDNGEVIMGSLLEESVRVEQVMRRQGEEKWRWEQLARILNHKACEDLPAGPSRHENELLARVREFGIEPYKYEVPLGNGVSDCVGLDMNNRLCVVEAKCIGNGSSKRRAVVTEQMSSYATFLSQETKSDVAGYCFDDQGGLIALESFGIFRYEQVKHHTPRGFLGHVGKQRTAGTGRLKKLQNSVLAKQPAERRGTTKGQGKRERSREQQKKGKEPRTRRRDTEGGAQSSVGLGSAVWGGFRASQASFTGEFAGWDRGSSSAASA